IDETATPPGGRLLRRWLSAPLVDVGAIRRRLDAVEAFVRHPLARAEFRKALGDVGDLERLGVRAALGEATPEDVGALRDGLPAVPRVRAAARNTPDPGAREALGLESAPPATLDTVAEELSRALVDRPSPLVRDGGIFREGYDAGLDETRRLKD